MRHLSKKTSESGVFDLLRPELRETRDVLSHMSVLSVCLVVCLSVCMYVCMYVRSYVRTYVRMHGSVHACMHVCIKYELFFGGEAQPDAPR